MKDKNIFDQTAINPAYYTVLQFAIQMRKRLSVQVSLNFQMLYFHSIRLLHFNLKYCTRDIQVSLDADLNYHSQGLRQSGLLGSWEPIDCVKKKLGNLMTENPPIEITDEILDSFTFFI